MPWTLYRYIFKDLLKLLLLSTAVLVTVISFAASIKPLSDGLLGPGALLRYVVYLMPTMLALALPFSGAFASTLVFARMTSDNELVACRASGLSYGTVLLPVLGLGVTLTLGVWLLSNWVVPRFYQAAERMLQRDLTHVIVNQIQSGRSVQIKDWALYATAADDSQPPPHMEGVKVQPSRLIMLEGVAVGKLEGDGTVRTESTAERANVLVWDVDGDTWVTMRLINPLVYDPGTGRIMVEDTQIAPILVPSAFRDHPQFLTFEQLRNLGQEPERYRRVRELKRKLAEALAAQRLLALVERSIDKSRDVPLTLLGPTGEQYRVSAPLATRSGDTMQLRSGTDLLPILVEIRERGVATRRLEAQRAGLRIESGEPDPEPRVIINLHDVRVFDARIEGRGTEHTTVELPRLRWPGAITEEISRADSFELILMADALRRERQAARLPAPAAVLHANKQLHDMMLRLGRMVTSQHYGRAASAVVCMLGLLLGAVLAMLLRDSNPLFVYFLTFILVIVTVIIIRSGDNMATDLGQPLAWGLAVTWLGNLVLAVVLLASHRRLART